MKFVHTFSLTRFSERDEIDALEGNYHRGSFIYNSYKKGWALIPYASSGLVVEIEPIPNDSGKRKYDKKHPLYEMKIHVTPAKLLNPGVNMGGLTSKEEIEKACEKLKVLVNMIEEKSDVNILSQAYLCRVDVTKDCITPSDLYSHEIIQALKKSIDKCGYKRYNPKTNYDYNVAWHEEDAILFHNDSQRVGGKVYNKKRDLRLNGHYEDAERIGDRGLLRFEISLLYQRLKSDYAAGEVMTCEKLSEVLWSVTSDAEKLFHTHFSDVFYPGAMVSREVMKAYINREYTRGTDRQEKMMAYSDSITGKKGKKATKKYTDAKIIKRKKWFAAIGLSPISVNRECPYIPSVADLIEDRIDTEMLEFAERKTAWHLDFLYWQKESIPT